MRFRCFRGRRFAAQVFPGQRSRPHCRGRGRSPGSEPGPSLEIGPQVSVEEGRARQPQVPLPTGRGGGRNGLVPKALGRAQDAPSWGRVTQTPCSLDGSSQGGVLEAADLGVRTG